MDGIEVHPWEMRTFKKIQLSLLLLLIVALSCLIFIGIVTYKFFKKHRGKKKIFKLFLVWINLSILFRLAFIINWMINNRANTWVYSEKCLNSVVSYSNIIFLSVAGVLNVYNWLRFSFTFHSFSSMVHIRDHSTYKVLKFVLLASLLLITITNLSGLLWIWIDKNPSLFFSMGYYILNYFNCIIFISLGVSFLLVGWNLK